MSFNPYSTARDIGLYRASTGDYVWFFQDHDGKDMWRQLPNSTLAILFGKGVLGIHEYNIMQAMTDLTQTEERMRKAELVALFGDLRGDYFGLKKLEDSEL